MTTLDQARRRRRGEIGAQRHHQDVALEPARVQCHGSGHRVDSQHVRADQAYTGMDTIGVPQQHMINIGTTEH